MPASESSIVGKAGELRVASELLLRGYLPLIGAVDDGVDVALTNGATIQVKTCRYPQERDGRSYFVFTLHSLRERGNGGKRVHRHNLTAMYVIFWCVDKAFYVVPREAIAARHTVSIPAEARGASQWDEWRERWAILTRLAEVVPD